MTTQTEHRPIVVGYDTSDTAHAALHWAGSIADSEGAEVNVVFAAQPQLIAYASTASYGLWPSIEEQTFAEEIAREGAQRLEATHPHVPISTTASLDSPTVALDKASRNASLVVVGSHGRGRVGSVMLGSTAYALSGHARCPVIVVRDAEAPLPGADHAIVVGSDGSQSSDRAVAAAADLAARWNAPLLVVTACPAPDMPWGRPPPGFASLEAFTEERIGTATLTNQASLRTAQQTVPHALGIVIEGRPEDAVMQADPNAAMLVLGSRGHGGLAGALLGSTARNVLHQTSKPVMIVH